MLDISYNYEEISPQAILERVPQEHIFHLALGFYPEVKKYIINPLRANKKDTRPGAWFSWYNGKLYLVDFADERTHRTCFQSIQDAFGLTFREALLYINQQFDLGFEGEGEIKPKKFIVQENNEVVTKKRSIIEYTSKAFDSYHKKYWSAYEITSNQLLSDGIVAVSNFKFYSKKTEKWHFVTPLTNDVTFAITDPLWDDRVKICRALVKDKKQKWTNTTTKEDIGGTSNLEFLGKLLIIKKSYKDWRVVTNQGFQAIWVQNEGMLPNIDTLLPLISTFDNILIWFDNDDAGIKAAIKMKEYLNPYHNSISTTHLPTSLLRQNITDPSDCIKKDKKFFKQFINKLHGKYQ